MSHKDDRSGRVIGGLIVLGLGVIFLLSELDVIPDLGKMWPLILVVIGIALLAGAVVKREKGTDKKEEEFHDQ